jgi:hypothetical protein
MRSNGLPHKFFVRIGLKETIAALFKQLLFRQELLFKQVFNLNKLNMAMVISVV